MSELPEDFIEQIRKIARTDPKLAEWVKGIIADNPDIIEGRTIFGGDFRSVDLYNPVNPPSQNDEPVMGDGQGDGSGSLAKNRDKRGIDDDKDFGGPPGEDPKLNLKFADPNDDPFDDKNIDKTFARGLEGYEDIDTGDPIAVYLDGRFRKPPGWKDEDTPGDYPDYIPGWSWRFTNYKKNDSYNSKYQLIPSFTDAVGEQSVTPRQMLAGGQKNPFLSMWLERWSTQSRLYGLGESREATSYTKEAEYIVNKKDERYHSQQEMLDSYILEPYLYVIAHSQDSSGVAPDHRGDIHKRPSIYYKTGDPNTVVAEQDTSNIRTPQWPIGKKIDAVKAAGNDYADMNKGKDYKIGDPVPGDTPVEDTNDIIGNLLELERILERLNEENIKPKEIDAMIEKTKRNIDLMDLQEFTTIGAKKLVGIIRNLGKSNSRLFLAEAVRTAHLLVMSLLQKEIRKNQNDILELVSEEAKKQRIADKAARDKAVKEELARKKARQRAQNRKIVEDAIKEMNRRADLDEMMSQNNVKWFITYKGAYIKKIEHINSPATKDGSETSDKDEMWGNKVGQIIENNIRFKTHPKDSIIPYDDLKYENKITIKLRRTATKKIHTFETNAFNGVRIINSVGKITDFDSTGKKIS